MKKIEAVIKPFKLEDVTSALVGLGIMGMTVIDVKGHGRQKGHAEGAISSESIDFIPKVKIEVVVADSQLDAALKAIVDNAKTGKLGDGKIFVSSIEKAIRIRTGDINEEAL